MKSNTINLKVDLTAAQKKVARAIETELRIRFYEHLNAELKSGRFDRAEVARQAGISLRRLNKYTMGYADVLEPHRIILARILRTKTLTLPERNGHHAKPIRRAA